MTRSAVELHTFTREELDTIMDALKVADAEYRSMYEKLGWIGASTRDQFLRQAEQAADLRLRIEVAL